MSELKNEYGFYMKSHTEEPISGKKLTEAEDIVARRVVEIATASVKLSIQGEGFIDCRKEYRQHHRQSASCSLGV